MLYGAALVVLGLVLGDEAGIFIDIIGLAMVALGSTLFAAYYIDNRPK